MTHKKKRHKLPDSGKVDVPYAKLNFTKWLLLVNDPAHQTFITAAKDYFEFLGISLVTHRVSKKDLTFLKYAHSAYWYKKLREDDWL